MKKNVLYLLIVFVAAACSPNKKLIVFGDESNQIGFDDTTKDLGIINQGDLAEFDYEFTNTGKSPVTILNAVPTCGCVSAKFESTPVPPKGKGKIKVSFDSKGKEGVNEKSIVVQTTLANPNDIIVLSFKVNVNTQK